MKSIKVVVRFIKSVKNGNSYVKHSCWNFYRSVDYYDFGKHFKLIYSLVLIFVLKYTIFKNQIKFQNVTS